MSHVIMCDREVESAVAEIRDLIDTRTPGNPVADRIRGSRVYALKKEMLAEYGHRRGWKQSRAEFTFHTLASGKQHSGGWSTYDPCAIEDSSGRLFDHASYWKKDRYPAAILLQPYAKFEDHAYFLAQWASRVGLVVQCPPDLPSWWFPGFTTLIEVTRIPEVAA